MATITPGRLNDVSNAADHVTLVQDNFEILTEELFKLTPTFQNGVPNTIVGPPTSGARMLDELWRDVLGGLFRCTAAGTPGTWRQILPAVVASPPGSGTVPVGYLVVDMAASGVLKRKRPVNRIWRRVTGRVGLRGATALLSSRWRPEPLAGIELGGSGRVVCWWRQAIG